MVPWAGMATKIPIERRVNLRWHLSILSPNYINACAKGRWGRGPHAWYLQQSLISLGALTMWHGADQTAGRSDPMLLCILFFIWDTQLVPGGLFLCHAYPSAFRSSEIKWKHSIRGRSKRMRQVIGDLRNFQNSVLGNLN